jgi:hypothetical protein
MTRNAIRTARLVLRPYQPQGRRRVASGDWGRGLGTEPAAAAVGFGFDVAAAARIVAATDPPNPASCRLMERIGLAFEGRALLEGLDPLFSAIERQRSVRGAGPWTLLPSRSRCGRGAWWPA